MKRKTLSLLLALVLCLSPLTASASAAGVARLPAVWAAPENVLLTREAGEEEFCLRVSYSVGADHSTFVDDVEYNENYAKYGLSEAVYHTSTVQVDWRVDEGPWHYDPIWDTGDEDRPGADTYLYYRGDAPYGNERTGYTYILRLPLREDWDSNYEGWRDAMAAQGVTELQEGAGGYMQLNLERHRVDVRVRLITRVIGPDVDAALGETNAYYYILSPWSGTASIGRGAGAVQRPESLPAPQVENFTVAQAQDSGFVPDGYPVFRFNLAVPASVAELSARAAALGASMDAQVQVKTGSSDYVTVTMDGGWDSCSITDGLHTGYMPGLSQDGVTSVLGGSCLLRVRYRWYNDGGQELYSPWSRELSFTSDNWQCSDWAREELRAADEQGLIPDELREADLRQPITRREFAAVCVKLYENLGNTTALPAVNNPFRDTNDAEVLKAYNAGITDGVDEGVFQPDKLLSRQEAATMLTRVFKRVTLSGWTLATDGDYTLPFDMPAAFADDGEIAPWARNSVYFMAANGIIEGVEGHRFAPVANPSASDAANYGRATREQALAIALRMVNNL